jgi:hypothetical protein
MYLREFTENGTNLAPSARGVTEAGTEKTECWSSEESSGGSMGQEYNNTRGTVGALSMRRRIWLAWSRWPHLTRQTHSSRATWVCEAQGGEEEVTGHTPHVTRHASQVTCHMSYLHVVCPDAVEPQLHHAITVPGSKYYKETLKVLQRNAESETKNATRECTAPHSS